MKAITDVLWSERSRDEFPDWAKRGAVVIVPIGSIEQHGVALPVDTDSRTVEYVARQAARLAEDVPVLVTPTMPLGVSPHHMAYPGTISLRVETVLHVLGDICESVVAHGFDRILILSGHGGNGGTIAAAALELQHRLDRQIRACCWFDLIPEEINATREGVWPNIGHAGEMEASCILALTPDAVRGGKLKLVDGVTDDPSLGTAAKGEKVLGTIYELTDRDLRRLDKYEGCPGNCNRLNVIAFNENNEPIEAVTYIKTGQSEETQPSPAYLSVMRQGCKDWGILL